MDAGSAYADAALHADGLASLQARDESGGATHEIQSSVKGPGRLKLTKRGDRFPMSISPGGETLPCDRISIIPGTILRVMAELI